MAAVTADQVQVDMSVDISTYIANLRKADAAFTQVMNKLEAEAKTTSAAFSTITILPVPTQPVDKLNQSLAKTNLQTGNLAAQLNDIGVQLAGGQSPFLIALQQGSQINQAIGQAGAAGAVKALGGAFLSLVNPVSLATIAIIALGGAAIQYLATLGPSFETVNEAVDRHRKALEGIVEGYDAAQQAVGDYTSAASQLPRSIAIQQINQQFKEISDEAEEFRQSASQIGGLFVEIGSRAEKALSTAASQFASGQITAEEFYLELQRIRTTDMGPLDFALGGVIGTMEEGALKAIAFGNAINQVVAASHALAGIAQDQTLANFFDENAVENVIDTLRGLTPELRTQQQIIADTYSKALTNPALTEEAREQLRIAKESALAAVAEKDARDAATEAARTAAAASKQSAAEKERERESVQSLIEQLQFELETVGFSNQQKAIANALRRAGAAATDDERAKIEALIVARDQELEKLREAEELYNAIKAAAEQSLKGFLNDLAQGKSLGEAFKNVLNDILSKLIDFGVSTALNAIFPGLGSFSVPSPRAMGGPVSANRTYLVGERGPELFTPSNAGQITSNSDLANMGSGGAGRVVIELGPGLEASMLDKSARQSVSIVKATVPGMIGTGAPQAVATSQRNRVI